MFTTQFQPTDKLAQMIKSGNIKLAELEDNQLLWLLHDYDAYIQQANEKDDYVSGWRPVCVNEFANNEWLEILEYNYPSLFA